MHPEYKAEEEKDAMGSRDQNARGKGRKSQIIGGSNRNISKAKTPYVGLCNQGATCYMNSLLQTLFMTSEFRETLYQWKYKEEEHGKKMYCIPYQVQKLFAQLQIGQRDHVDTKALTTSFNWDVAEVLQQQDIQEFCRVLFDKIVETDRSIEISKCYEGTLVDYVKCLECNYASEKIDKFLDLSLPINDPFTKTKNSSLEEALENYIKSESLTGPNQYECSQCQSKQDAEKGLKFSKFPNILALQLNRFTLNYETFTRIKLNDRVTFPFILNMNNYANGYSGIKQWAKDIKPEIEASLFDEEYSTKPTLPAHSRSASTSKTAKTKTERKYSGPDMQGRYRMGDGFESTPGKSLAENRYGDLELEDVGMMGNPYMFESQPPKTKYYGQPEEIEMQDIVYTYPPTDNQDSLYTYSVQHEGEKFFLGRLGGGNLISQGNEEDKELEEAQSILTKNTKKEEKAAWSKLRKEKREKEIKEYFEEGDDVYELFSVMVHSGNAFGGHYYVYIKSFEDGFWYNYNDRMVSLINQDYITRTYGGTKIDLGNTANAYSLMYRRLNKDEPDKTHKFPEDDIPIYLTKEINLELELIKKIKEKERQQAKMMTLTVWIGEESKFLIMEKTHTLNNLKEKIMSDFHLDSTPWEDCRVRQYNSKFKLMAETYTGRESKTLGELGINPWKELVLEIKTDNREEFEEFKESDYYVKIGMWKEGLMCLDDDHMLPFLFPVNRDMTLIQFQEILAKHLGIETPFLLRIMKKKNLSQNDFYLETQMLEEDGDKSLQKLTIWDGTSLFIELMENMDELNKPSRFKKILVEEKNRIFVRCNHPDTDPTIYGNEAYIYSLIISKTNTTAELKQKICDLLKINSNEHFMKRGSTYSAMVKEGNIKISSLGFLKNTTLFIGKGPPSQENEYKVSIYIGEVSKLDAKDQELFDFEQLFFVNVKSSMTGYQFKTVVVELYNKTHQPGIDINFIRLREKSTDRMGKCLKEDLPIKSLGLYDEKSFVIQIIKEPEVLTKLDLMVVIRMWDPATWELSPRYEIVVNKLTLVHMFSYQIAEIFPYFRNKMDRIMLCKVPSLYNFKRGDLITQNFEKVYGYKNKILEQAPFFLATDGYLLIVRDSEVDIGSMSEEMAEKHGTFLYRKAINKQIQGAREPLKRPRYKEKGITIKIKTVSEQQKEEEARKKSRENPPPTTQITDKIKENNVESSLPDNTQIISGREEIRRLPGSTSPPLPINMPLPPLMPKKEEQPVVMEGLIRMEAPITYSGEEVDQITRNIPVQDRLFDPNLAYSPTEDSEGIELKPLMEE